MKTDIHPTYNEKTTVTCSCGNSFDVGSTADALEVEVCSACHPFYTGKQKLVDVAGRIDRFKQRVEDSAKAEKSAAKHGKKKADRKDQDKKKDDDTVKLG